MCGETVSGEEKRSMMPVFSSAKAAKRVGGRVQCMKVVPFRGGKDEYRSRRAAKSDWKDPIVWAWNARVLRVRQSEWRAWSMRKRVSGIEPKQMPSRP